MIKIVTDSDANLSQEVLDEYGIAVAPIHLVFGNEVLRERVDLTDEEAYRRMSESPELPKTSQPPVGEFTTIYEQILREDPGATILSIHISTDLSGTLSSARQAAALLEEDTDLRGEFHFFDTRSASLGQGLMVRQAAEMARQGASIEDILAELEHMRDRTHVYFSLETIDYLAKGGRIGRASHLIGNVLDIKPVLTVKDGIIDSHARFRTRRRALQGLHDIVANDINGNAEGVQIAVLHAMSEAAGSQLADDLQQAFSPEVMMFGEIGPGLGVHTGPGAVGVCYYIPLEET